jgi:hypothetical protein
MVDGEPDLAVYCSGLFQAMAVGNDEDFAQHRRVCRHRSLLSVREEYTPVQLFGRARASSSGSAGRTSSGSSRGAIGSAAGPRFRSRILGALARKRAGAEG